MAQWTYYNITPGTFCFRSGYNTFTTSSFVVLFMDMDSRNDHYLGSMLEINASGLYHGIY